MPQTATEVVTTISFSKFASDVRQCELILGHKEDRIKKEIIKQAPAWVGAHVKVDNNCDVIHLEGTNGHPYWSQDVRSAINKVLPYHKNSAGRRVTLRADGDRF